MKQPMNRKQNSSSPQKTQIIIVSVLLGIGILLLCGLLAFMFRGNILQFVSPTTPTQAIPTMFVPTPDCGLPTLVVGSTTYQIQNITPAPDGSVTVPSDTSGIAYWVTGTDTNAVFVLSATPDNTALLSNLPSGATAEATLKNCNSTTYNLAASQPGPVNISTLLDQSKSGITVIIQSDPATAGFVIKGELMEEQISTINTPAANGSGIQAEISLLETTTSPDGTSIKVGISIQNNGVSAFTLSMNDVSLTQPDATPLVMASSEPSLPKEIQPGATETLHFTFPRPTSATATLKIFEIEYDLSGY